MEDGKQRVQIPIQRDRQVAIHIDLDPRVNYAMQQNDVPVVKRLCIENLSTEPLRDVVVRVRTEPPLSAPWEARVESIAPGATHGFESVPLVFDPGRLVQQVEREKALLRVEVDAAGTVVASSNHPIEVLAYNEWNGSGSLPEILAAFVLPNHPALPPLLARAGDILEAKSGSRSLAGYQTGDPDRVRAVAGALFEAVREKGLTYVEPPASFEERGQKIRTPDQVLETRLGTCLDLATLLAALYEQAGLHSLVVILKGHAFTGVWLANGSFPEPAVLDPLALRKRVDLDAILLVETTVLGASGEAGFLESVVAGRRHLDNPEKFLFAIDLKAARRARIRPLPARVSGAFRVLEPPAGEAGPGASSAAGPGASPTESLPAGPPGGPADPPETPHARILRWKRHLLDLSLRNRLLHFRETKTTIPLLCPDLGAFEDVLADGKAFALHPKPALMEGNDPRDAAAHRARTGEDALKAYLMDEIRDRRLRTGLGAEELTKRLIGIDRAARLSLEESGANTLYLSLGFLRWYETETSTQERRAPLLLLPLSLKRTSVRSAFQLTLAEEEARVNVTLLQKLTTDYGIRVEGVDTPPEDAHGYDVPAILRAFRTAVVNMPRWDVAEEAAIGFFSFTKFLMWNDLEERTADLMKNALVHHLVETPDAPFEAGGEFPDPATLDDKRRPVDTFCLMDADSSQLAAVFAAADGRSFVLEGPPGTGKSQTITNIIAHGLALGKRVLFVAEKQAALNVVFDRLQKVGLGPFCLELHSNKASKHGVMEQLQASMATAGALAPPEWEERAQRLGALRLQLNGYARALHLPREFGMTAFEATATLVRHRESPRVAFGPGLPDPLTRETYQGLVEGARRLAATGAEVGDLPSHPWRSVRRGEWEPSVGTEAERKATAIEEKAAALEAAIEAVGVRLPGVSVGLSGEGLTLLVEGIPLLLETPGPAPALLLDAGWEGTRETLLGVVSRMRRRNDLRKRLFEIYEKRILDLDLDVLHRRLAGALDTWPPMSWIGIFRVRNVVKPVTRGGAVPPAAKLLKDLNAARELRDLEADLRSAADPVRLLGGHWKGGEVDPDAVEAQVEWAGKFRSFLHRFVEASAPAGEGRPAWADLAAGEPAGRPLRDLRDRLIAFEKERQALTAFLELDEVVAWGGNAEPGHIARVRAACAPWKTSGSRLRPWCAWRRARIEAAAAGLDPLAAACEKGEIPPHRLPEAFARSFFQWWFEKVLHGEPVLRDFFSADHEERIREFRALDAHVLELTRGVVLARLAARVPQANQGNAPANSEVGILLRETKRQRGHMPLRKLVGKVPNLLSMLKPCLLMSPLSIAQYLDPAFAKVDLVVFDEASQIPVWDAVGAIARGRQVVVVGDSKQLPPTMFFEKGEGDEPEEVAEGDVRELESVLDDCVASQVRRLYLEWHYRSRHESLIAFSNHHYYDNRLLTFPSSVKESPRVGVSLVRVPGVYDRGGSSTNRAEAEAVVAEILRRLHDPDERHRSIGVVTFSQVQQTLVEDLLEEARKKDLSVDPWFTDAVPEPVFIKNLENVQGDERDVILFSVCYGPDAAGKMMMNFGPLNRDGGERRLNVAVTRAREQVVVFSSIGPEAIDRSKTRARGVADLKTFLDYAARGQVALVSAVGRGRGADYESPLEKAVADALRAKGWEVEAQVGCSGYRIDLAVKDPGRPGEYLCGIECDGASYHSARTARDRDRLREEVLRRIGWTILRVWSTDWWYEPGKMIEVLDRRLGDLRDAAKARGRDPLDLGHTNPLEAAPPPAGEAPPAPRPEAPRPIVSPIAGASAAPEITAPALPGQSEYRAWKGEGPQGTPDDFYEPRQNRAIAGLIRAVVAVEGPVAVDLACRRVAGAWSIERITERVRHRLLGVIRQSCPEVRVEGAFLWPREQKAEAYSGFRVPGTDCISAREAEAIPPEEAANAAAALLPRLVSLPRRDLVREMAKLFGFHRLGQRVEERMEEGVSLLANRGGCSVEGDLVSVPRR
ncbi:MAG: DUF3320 domain-containing protein [Planctomycetota bacterium]